MFAATTLENVLVLLGYPADESAIAEIRMSLTRVEAITDIVVRDGLISLIEAWLNELDTIFGKINVERDTEDSTLLLELRREGRRYVVLVSNLLSLPVRLDTLGSTPV